jgi:hypothetical protein
MSMGGEDMGDYATLSGGMALHNDGSAHSSLRGTPRDVRTFRFEILCNIYGLTTVFTSCVNRTSHIYVTALYSSSSSSSSSSFFDVSAFMWVA